MILDYDIWDFAVFNIISMYDQLTFPFDGIEIDDEGYIYAAEPGANRIIVIPPQGGGPWSLAPRKIVGDGPPLQGPTSLVLRDGVLYTANLAWFAKPEERDNTIIAIKGFSKK